MKKNKKFTPMPVIETKPARGSVGEFIEILKDFDPEAKFELNGAVNIGIDLEGQPGSVKITPVGNAPAEVVEEPFFNEEDEVQFDGVKAHDNVVMDGYLFGLGRNDAEFNNSMRHMPTDYLVESPLTMPNDEELQYEGRELMFPQVVTIDEIRQHNMYVAECMGELYRRQVAALLEYNTQCLAHFGAVTNKIMCNIVDDID